jgi:hypothetical protein
MGVDSFAGIFVRGPQESGILPPTFVAGTDVFFFSRAGAPFSNPQQNSSCRVKGISKPNSLAKMGAALQHCT